MSQELFHDAVHQDSELSLENKEKWMHDCASDYWLRLEAIDYISGGYISNESLENIIAEGKAIKHD